MIERRGKKIGNLDEGGRKEVLRLLKNL